VSEGIVSYRPGEGPIHSLHPITKVVLVVSVIAGAYLAPTPVVVALLAALVAATAADGVLGAVWRPAVTILLPLGAGLVVIHGLFTRGEGAALAAVGPWTLGGATVGPVTLWRAGVEFALATFLVLAAFVLAGLLFVTTTHPKRLMVGLIEAGVPRKLGYVFVASLQLVPELQRRARNILDAQRSRGLDTGGSPRERIRALVALFGPLLIGTLVSTQTRSLALEARGFSMEGPRTSLYDLPETTVDHALRLGGVIAVAGLGAWRLL